MLSDRRKIILKAIVEEHIATAEPVGSKALTEKPYLKFSSATIRNDMAELEKEGFIEKTHASSGRVPSNEGYKYYVENLVTRDYDVIEEFPLIDEIFDKNLHDKEEAIKESLSLLSSLTNCTTLQCGREIENCKIAKLDLVPLSDTEALMLVVTDNAKVVNQTFTIPDELTIDNLQSVFKVFNETLVNKTLGEVKTIIRNENFYKSLGDYIDYQEEIVNSFVKAFSKFQEQSTNVEGRNNLFKHPDFTNVVQVKEIMDIMENKDVFKVVKNESKGLTVKIGNENKLIAMNDCTVVSVPYKISDDEYGSIAVLGPTRMEYKRVIPLVEYIAKNMTKMYKK